jgi:hypothetical protein
MEKTAFTCQACGCSVEKDDAQFVDEETFSFLTKPPIALGSYCVQCFDGQVRPVIQDYESKMERAKDVNIFFSTQGKETRFVRRTERPVKVEDCLDRDEAVLRLAFLAVEAEKNSLVDVEISSVKVRNGSYQTSRWNGRAVPAQIAEESLNRKFPGSPN